MDINNFTFKEYKKLTYEEKIQIARQIQDGNKFVVMAKEIENQTLMLPLSGLIIPENEQAETLVLLMDNEFIIPMPEDETLFKLKEKEDNGEHLTKEENLIMKAVRQQMKRIESSVAASTRLIAESILYICKNVYENSDYTMQIDDLLATISMLTFGVLQESEEYKDEPFYHKHINAVTGIATEYGKKIDKALKDCFDKTENPVFIMLGLIDELRHITSNIYSPITNEVADKIAKRYELNISDDDESDDEKDDITCTPEIKVYKYPLSSTGKSNSNDEEDDDIRNLLKS